MEYKLL